MRTPGLRSQAVLLAGVMLASLSVIAAQRGGSSVSIDADDIGGVVSGPKGPEAGVWVTVETTDLPTKFVRIVVTDDQGRYLIPDLPKANYSVWVRGYGLVDSPKVKASAGAQLNLKAVPAPDAVLQTDVVQSRRPCCRLKAGQSSSSAMFSFLERDIPAAGLVLYRGSIAPPFDQLRISRNPLIRTKHVSVPEYVWSVEATHPQWGSVEIRGGRGPFSTFDNTIDHMLTLSEDEKALAQTGEASVIVRVTGARTNVLRDRKRLLYWLRELMQPDGVVAVDLASTLMWSQAMLDDELAHDADLDIESLYVLHAVQDADDSRRVSWLHTHGLAHLGAFDLDILDPSPNFVASCADPIRSGPWHLRHSREASLLTPLAFRSRRPMAMCESFRLIASSRTLRRSTRAGVRQTKCIQAGDPCCAIQSAVCSRAGVPGLCHHASSRDLQGRHRSCRFRLRRRI